MKICGCLMIPSRLIRRRNTKWLRRYRVWRILEFQYICRKQRHRRLSEENLHVTKDRWPLNENLWLRENILPMKLHFLLEALKDRREFEREQETTKLQCLRIKECFEKEENGFAILKPDLPNSPFEDMSFTNSLRDNDKKPKRFERSHRKRSALCGMDIEREKKNL